jgi:hydrogenase expression/formation protein HypC
MEPGIPFANEAGGLLTAPRVKSFTRDALFHRPLLPARDAARFYFHCRTVPKLDVERNQANNRVQSDSRASIQRDSRSPLSRETAMCLAIPAQVCEKIQENTSLALVDVLGVRRRISLELLADDPPQIGDWVLVHVGFAMSKISDEQARETLAMLDELGEADAAREEVQEAPGMADQEPR